MIKYYTLLVVLIFNLSSAQVGIGTTSPNLDSLLELQASDKGLLISRVALSSLTSASPLTSHTAGMFVYNTATSGVASNNIVPGLYYNNGTSWEKAISNVDVPKKIGIERLSTVGLVQFTRPNPPNTELIWTAGGVANCPAFNTTATLMAPYGSTTSNITVTSGITSTDSDTFTCSKNIISLKVFTAIQTSTASTSRWRTILYLNGINTFSYWGNPPNNVTNVRTTGYFEYGPIPANTAIGIRIEANALPVSTQNSGSYFVIEYEY